MKKSKRFKQSYKNILKDTIAWYKDSSNWTDARIAYGLGLGEMYEWANDCKLSAKLIYN